MCNLYSVTTNQEAIRRLFRVDRMNLGNLPPLPGIFPGQEAPVVRRDGDGARELAMLRWGFVLPQDGRAPKDVTNARTDKVASSPFWRQSFEQRRCLVPVSSFCEWTDVPDPVTRRKVPHWFGLREGQGPRPVFAFAGLWRHWRGSYKGDLVEWDVFAFLTTTPNEIVAPIHTKAMPVMLTVDDWDQWIDGTPEVALALAKPFPAERMAIVHSGETRDQVEASV